MSDIGTNSLPKFIKFRTNGNILVSHPERKTRKYGSHSEHSATDFSKSKKISLVKFKRNLMK
jgi:hypothetical protein